MQGGGVVWRRGGRPDMVNALIPGLKTSEGKMAAATSGACMSVCAGGCWTGCAPYSLVGGLVRHSVFR